MWVCRNIHIVRLTIIIQPSYGLCVSVRVCLCVSVLSLRFKQLLHFNTFSPHVLTLFICIATGWDKHSYGYHGDDGHSFCSSGTGQPYGPTFTTGDVIGCCVNLINNTCFYTKNGHSLGTENNTQ